MHATANDQVQNELATAVRRLSHIAAAHVILNSQSADEQVIGFREYLTSICIETHKALGNDGVGSWWSKPTSLSSIRRAAITHSR